MVILRFLGEGPQDVGPSTEECDSESVERQGCIPHFVENLLNVRRRSPVIFAREKDYLPRLHLESRRARGRPRRGYKAKVRAAIVQAHEDQIDGIVIVVDEPASRESRRLPRLQAGRDEARQDGVMTPCALGVAIQEIEAWLLADGRARAKHLGKAGRRPLPAHPERIPNPRSLFSGLYGEHRSQCESEGSHVPPEWRVKESCAIDARVRVLEDGCPAGFAPFAEEVRREIAHTLFPRRRRG